jgi:hypothetical protein
MDDIFEQILSAPSWGDNVGSLGMERMDSIHRVQPTLVMGGSIDNQRSSLYATSDEEFDLNFKNGLGMLRPATKSQIGTSWKEPFVENILPMSSNTGVLANNTGFPSPNDAILHNMHLGKRTREGEDLLDATDMVSPDLTFLITVSYEFY